MFYDCTDGRNIFKVNLDYIIYVEWGSMDEHFEDRDVVIHLNGTDKPLALTMMATAASLFEKALADYRAK